MITRKELADLLIKYANPNICGAPSLGFIPSLLFARWAWDNQSAFASRVWNAKWTWDTPWVSTYPDFKRKYSTDDFFKDSLTAENIRDKARILTGMCWALSEEDDVEQIFAADKKNFRHTNFVYGKYDEARKEIASLDLSANSISTTDVAAALDDYLDSFQDIFIAHGEQDSLANHVVGRLVQSIITDETSIFDPFCKFGYLLQVAGPGLHKIAAAESELYKAITFIRMILRDMPLKLAPTSSIKNPLTTEDGKMVRYPLVVTNISEINNDTESAAYQLDTHQRFQTLLPTNNSLNQTSAAINAFGFTNLRGHCFIICDRGRMDDPVNPTAIFTRMRSQETLLPFLMQDYIEAVIKIPSLEPRGPNYYRSVLGKSLHTYYDSSISEIYILSRNKSPERRNRIQFIDASSCTSKSEILDKITDVYTNMKEIPGFSVMVSLDKITTSNEPILRPEWFTCTIEHPQSEEFGKLNRELERLEKQRESVAADIHNVARVLSEKTTS